MKSGDVSTRLAEIRDASDMARLSGQMGYPMSASDMEARLARLLSNPLHRIFVASNFAGEVLGWIHVEQRTSLDEGDRAELLGLIVDTKARRLRIGRSLIEEVRSWAMSRGLNQLAVRSNTTRSESHPFYEAVGFVRRKTQHVYTMTLPLDRTQSDA